MRDLKLINMVIIAVYIIILYYTILSYTYCYIFQSHPARSLSLSFSTLTQLVMFYVRLSPLLVIFS